MPDQPEPTPTSRVEKPKRKSKAKLIVLAGGAGLILLGLQFLPAGASSLKPGDCFSGNPLMYPSNLSKVACDKAEFGDWRVVFSEEASGDSYPGNTEALGSKCKLKSGFFPPSKETWAKGDRRVICAKAVVPDSAP